MTEAEKIYSLNLLVQQLQSDQSRLSERLHTVEQQLTESKNKDKRNRIRAKELFKK